MPKLPLISQLEDDGGTIVTFTVPSNEVETIARYRYHRAMKDVKAFVQETVTSTVRWMDRMISGLERFELSTLEHWTYCPSTEYLTMKEGKRDQDLTFDMAFTSGTIEEYNQGLSTILNGFWYKTSAVPTAVVELIAAADLLYRQHHNDTSPGFASGLQHVDVDTNRR